MDRLYILAAALALAGFLSGGIYTVTGSLGNAVVINRFTGSVWYCTASGCSGRQYTN